MAAPSDSVAVSPRTTAPRLSRLGLVVWLLLPVVIVLGLWLMIDRTQGKPDPRLMSRPPAASGGGGAAEPAAPPAHH